MKTCSKCKIGKDKSEYYKNARTMDKLGCWCKDCNRVAKNEARKKNPEKRKKSDNRYYLKNIEKSKAYTSKYHKDHADRMNELKRKYYHEDKDKHNKRAKRYRDNNQIKEKKRSVKRYYPKGTPDEVLEAKVIQLLIKDELKKAS